MGKVILLAQYRCRQRQSPPLPVALFDAWAEYINRCNRLWMGYWFGR